MSCVKYKTNRSVDFVLVLEYFIITLISRRAGTYGLYSHVQMITLTLYLAKFLICNICSRIDIKKSTYFTSKD